jgi:hypothetical protein
MHGQEFRRSWRNRPFNSPRYSPVYLHITHLILSIQYIGLQILEKLITTRWKTLPDGQRQGIHYLLLVLRAARSCLGIRNFVVGITVKIASDETTMRKEKTFVNKLNLALVQVRFCFTACFCRSRILSSPDSEARVATQLAIFHNRTCRVVQNQPLAMREQHGHLAASI